MPAAPPISRYSPSYYRFPIQNNRTGFQPVYLPLILIVPGRRDQRGFVIGNTNVWDVKFYIANAPDMAYVAGPFNYPNLRVPNTDLYTLNILADQLARAAISLTPLEFFDPKDPSVVFPITQASEGDYFKYTTAGGSISSTIPYYPDADYYDMSGFSIGVEDLPRPKPYLFIWECQYYQRVTQDSSQAAVGGAFCINTDQVLMTRYTQTIYHPGDIHNDMFRKTPAFYFQEGVPLASNTYLQLIRPIADMFQDVCDEQQYLNGINQIFSIPPQLIPYLAYEIGWDLPNHPTVSDTTRRAILRYAVYLQQLKGSRRAITELFQIFGFNINLVNLWYSSNGLQLIGPGDKLPPNLQSEAIVAETVCQTEPLVANYTTPGFGQLTIPLLYKAISGITLNAWLVKDGPTQQALDGIMASVNTNPDALAGTCEQQSNGAYVPRAIFNKIPLQDPAVLGYSEISLDAAGNGKTIVSTANPLINMTNISFNNVTNQLTLNFDHYLPFNDGTQLYIFATYPYTKLEIPTILRGLRSNRFDVFISNIDGSAINTDAVEYLMNLLYRLKAFHSLLRKISFDVDELDVYNVTDYCSDDFNSLQIPPPVLPQQVSAETGCVDTASVSALSAAYTLRQNIISALQDEFTNWQALDGTHKSDPALEHFLNVPINRPNDTTCQFNAYGQDRVIQDGANHDISDTRQELCQLIVPSSTYCYKGRVKDELETKPILDLIEVVREKPCFISIGSGCYWEVPTDAAILTEDGFGKFTGQNTRGFLGKKVFQYNHPSVALHYTDRPYLGKDDFKPNNLLGYQRPQLEIEKESLNFPSHRYIEMCNMLTDYTSDYPAKPWDNDGELPATLVTGPDGDQYLVYAEAPLIYKGNGVAPDVSSLGEHDDRTYLVTHKIFMTCAPSHPAIELDDQVVITSQDAITLDSSVPFGPIFKSYNKGCNQDFISGYPACYGRQPVDTSSCV